MQKKRTRVHHDALGRRPTGDRLCSENGPLTVTSCAGASSCGTRGCRRPRSTQVYVAEHLRQVEQWVAAGDGCEVLTEAAWACGCQQAASGTSVFILRTVGTFRTM